METNSDYSIHPFTRALESAWARIIGFTPTCPIYLTLVLHQGILCRIPLFFNAHVQPKYFLQHVSEPFFHYFFTPAETRSSVSLLSSTLVSTRSMRIVQHLSDIWSPWPPVCYRDSNCARTIQNCACKWIREVRSICARSTQGGRKFSIKILGEKPSEARQMEWLGLENKAVIKQYLKN